MSSTPSVIVVGDVVTDVVVRGGPVAPGSDTDARITLTDGGAAANVASWLGALGVDVGLVARVGDDDRGRAATERLAEVGVVTTAITVDHQAPTGTVVVLVDVAGERTMLSDRGANLGLVYADLPARWFRAGAHLHLSGYLLFHARGRHTALAALGHAAAAGMSVSVDPSSWSPLRSLGRGRFLALTDGADLCFPNADEAQALTGSADAAVAAVALGGRYGQAVVTCGATGATWSDGTAVVSHEPAPGPVVDTTGAGDALTAGFLAAWLDGRRPGDALDEGLAMAARAIGRPGARP